MTEKKIYKVEGMTCASCASSVETLLQSINGVGVANVNLATNTVSIQFDEDKTNLFEFKLTLQPAGYLISEDINLSLDEEEKKRNAEIRNMKINLAGSTILSIPVFILSMFFHHKHEWFWIQLLLSLPIIFWFGRKFYIIGFKRLFTGKASMDTLIALGTGSAFVFSLFNTFFQDFLIARDFMPQVYYESAVIIITFILFGRYLEEKAKHNTNSSLRKLIGLQAKTAVVVRDGKEIEIDSESILIGDTIRVKPGGKIPVDGLIIEGFSAIDESMITGENLPQDKKNGDQVTGSTINLTGTLLFTATKVGNDTVLAHIIRQVKEAQGSKAPVQKLADKIASIFVPIVIAIALLSFGLWYWLSDNHNLLLAFNALFAVLVIACPCALGLATPTAIIAGIGKAAENGILIKDASALETTCKINVLAIDKTGTLTYGKQQVTGVFPEIKEINKNELNAIFSIEKHSEHPIAKAITTYLEQNGTNPLRVDQFINHSGMGVSAIVDGKKYFIGNELFVLKNKAVYSESIKLKASEFEKDAKSIVFVASDNEIIAVFGISDTIKESAIDSVRTIEKKGIEIHLLSGDNTSTVEAISRQAGISYCKGNMLPGDKLQYIKELQQSGKIVAMAGDGINDSPALTQANISFAMGTGTDIAIESAQITLLNGDLTKISKAIEFSEQTMKTIRQNLFWAFFYNIAAIPLAAGILYPIWHIQLSPMIAGAAMAFSSVTVVMNSVWLKRKLR
jgi:Cu2+-exporting ATPase